MTRKPVVAGMFYEPDFTGLDNQIKESFESKFGPGALPIEKRTKNIKGVIAPHAGYAFSGPAAAWAYKEVAEAEFCDTYILLGLSHAGYPNSISLEDWETSFGIVKNDNLLAEKIMQLADIRQDEQAHKEEHSIEVQLPFLQFANKDNLDRLRIVPIIISSGYEHAAKKIAHAVKESGKKACIIASSDFTHFGLNYGYFPFNSDIKKNLYDLDKKAISSIKKLDSKAFLGYIEKTGATICGRMPIAASIEITKALGAGKAKLLNYYTSGDIVDDYSSAVGYAGMVLE